MNPEIESHPIPAKRSRIFAKESAVCQHQQAKTEASPQKRWLCNELVHELCKNIPVLNSSERILLTSLNMHTYLTPRFRKMLIYRDTIAFLKTVLKAKKNVQIDHIYQLARKKVSGPIVLINQEQSDLKFALETSHFRVCVWSINDASNAINISGNDVLFGNAHLLYFLHLIAPLLQPIHLDLCLSYIKIEHLMRLLNALSCCIDSIGLKPKQFNSAPIDGALAKFDNLEIFGSSSVDAPKLVQWLTNHNGQSEKHLSVSQCRMFDLEKAPLIQLLDEIKKDFASATSRRRFIVRLELYEQLDEFTLDNEFTGEKLQLRLMNVENDWYAKIFYQTLSRLTNNEMDNTEHHTCAEFDSDGMTTLSLV